MGWACGSHWQKKNMHCGLSQVNVNRLEHLDVEGSTILKMYFRKIGLGDMA
jgi:hypothetical protein